MNGYPPPAVRLPAIRATALRTARGARALAGACHPLPTVAVTALVTAVAAAAGRGASGTAAVAVAVLAGQLSIGWANDAVDARRDAAVGRDDKPAANGALAPRVVAVAAVTALVLCVPLSLLSGTRAAAAHLAGVVGGGWAYDLGLKATWWSPLPYAIGFASLPAFVALGLPGHPWPAWWAVVGAALLGVGAHLVNVLPDLADDEATGIAGLPHRIGATWSRRCAAAVLAAALAVIAFGPPGSRDLSPGTPALVALGVALGVVGGVAVAGVALLLLFRQRSSGENVTASSRASDQPVRTSPKIRTDDPAKAPTTLPPTELPAPQRDTPTPTPTASTSPTPRPHTAATPGPSPRQAIIAAPPPSKPGTPNATPRESSERPGNAANQAVAPQPTTAPTAIDLASDPAAPATPPDSGLPTGPPTPDEAHYIAAIPPAPEPSQPTDTSEAMRTSAPAPHRDNLPFRIAIAIAALAVVLLIAHGGQIA